MGKMISYENKNFSIMGDSISTLLGCNPDGYEVFYTWDNCVLANVFSSADTWWGRVIEKLGGFRLINNSFSGSMVCKDFSCEIESYGCSDERTSNLGTEEENPDVIMILMGLNDFGMGMKLYPDQAGNARKKLLAYQSFSCSPTMQNGEVDSSNFPCDESGNARKKLFAYQSFSCSPTMQNGEVNPSNFPCDESGNDFSVFSVAYDTMLKKIKKNYPKAEIWCLTLPYGYRKTEPDQRPSLVRHGHHLSEYCDVIRACAKENGCVLLDIFHPEAPYDTIDDYHPNLDGMKTIADDVLLALERWES
ncbi:MAG: SGNH/GDSL hydrolase family protein [Clostridia bacterium]|nr:SGNH/GDSL hydrolase family protein [Clostridia bacterium]